MRVCVTGATGYVAGHIVRRLLEAGFIVHGTSRNPNRYGLHLYRDECCLWQFCIQHVV